MKKTQENFFKKSNEIIESVKSEDSRSEGRESAQPSMLCEEISWSRSNGGKGGKSGAVVACALQVSA